MKCSGHKWKSMSKPADVQDYTGKNGVLYQVYFEWSECSNCHDTRDEKQVGYGPDGSKIEIP